MRMLLLCLLLSADAQAAAPVQAPPLRPTPPQAPPLRPEPTEQTELRLIGDTIYEVPVGTEWNLTPRYKVLYRLPKSQPLTQPHSGPADCPTGFF